jgi:rod shape-determining protein MreC
MPGLFEGFVSRHRRGVTLAALVLVSFVCLLVSNRSVVIRPKEIGLSTVGFFQKGVTGFFRWFGDTAGSIGQLRLARAELDQARTRLVEADRMARENVELRRENAALLSELGLAQLLPSARVAAMVIARDDDNLFSTIVINKGSRSGIRRDMPVVAFRDGLEGLVGRVTEVGPGSAHVLPLYDPACQVSVRLDASRFEGLASGQGKDRDRLLMRYVKKIAKEAVQYGDLVVTAGLGGLYPAGIAVGRVRDFQVETYETSMTVELEPVIDFDRLEYVYALGPQAEAPAARSPAASPQAPGPAQPAARPGGPQ